MLVSPSTLQKWPIWSFCKRQLNIRKKVRKLSTWKFHNGEKKIFFSFFSIFEKTTPRPQIIARNPFLGMYITKSNRLKFLWRGKKRIENFFFACARENGIKMKILFFQFFSTVAKNTFPQYFWLKSLSYACTSPIQTVPNFVPWQ